MSKYNDELDRDYLMRLKEVSGWTYEITVESVTKAIETSGCNYAFGIPSPETLWDNIKDHFSTGIGTAKYEEFLEFFTDALVNMDIEIGLESESRGSGYSTPSICITPYIVCGERRFYGDSVSFTEGDSRDY